jgi:hypothetical protein
MSLIHSFHSQRHNFFDILNTTNIVLVPKEGGDTVSDFHPISLIHAVAKIIAKLMALRLQPLMNRLVSNAQSSFIKGRAIHDNFMYVRNLARRFHTSRTPTLLFKLDISKAFDSVRWDYLLDLLRRRGFPPRWRSWVSTLLFTASSKVVLNGAPGEDIQHGRGLRQGDPLSPLLFALAIDPLQDLLQLATNNRALSKLRGKYARLRLSLYADDVVIFLKPTMTDVSNLKELLHNFGRVTGLATNVRKSSVSPIRCAGLDLATILSPFPASRTSFPIKYLGLPLSLGRLKRVDFQPLSDKANSRLANWLGKFFSTAVRKTLVQSVLSSQPVYFLSALNAPAEVIEEIDRQRKRFLWTGTDQIAGGGCKVGILDLKKFVCALRLRWLWHEWKAQEKPWVGMCIPCTNEDRRLFEKSTKITIGNGGFMGL